MRGRVEYKRRHLGPRREMGADADVCGLRVIGVSHNASIGYLVATTDIYMSIECKRDMTRDGCTTYLCCRGGLV